MQYETRTAGSSVLVVVPALNEGDGIGPTLEEIMELLATSLLLVVDGRSSDRTVTVATHLGARVLVQGGSGKGDAISTALDFMRRADPDYVAFIDADYSYPAKYLPAMIDVLMRNPSVGMVCGNRFYEKHMFESMRSSFYVGNKLLSFVHSVLNNVDSEDPLTGLRVVRSEILGGWRPRSTGFDIEIELNCYVRRRGYRITEIPIQCRKRVGKKKLKYRHGFVILKRIVVESFESLFDFRKL